MQKTILVTGGTKGIGKEIVRSFLVKGHHVITTYSSDESAAHEFISEFKEFTHSLELKKFDMGSSLEILEFLDELKKEKKRVSVLVNNAGTLKQQDVFQLSEIDWNLTFNVNLRGPFILMQKLLPLMEPGDTIINITSIGGQTGGPKAPDYAASKAALECLTQSMARHGAPLGVRVNCVSPGWIDTGIFTPTRYQEIKEEAKAKIPLQRLGAPKEVASAVYFLSSQEASYITGHTLNVNGGLFF